MNKIEILLDSEIFAPFTGKQIFNGNDQDFTPSKAVLQISFVCGLELEDVDDIDEIIKYNAVEELTNAELLEDRKIIADLTKKLIPNFPLLCTLYISPC
jgi:hypothetical protein